MEQLTRDLDKESDVIGNHHMATILAPFCQDDHIYFGALLLQNNGEYLLPEGDLSICYSGPWNNSMYAQN